MKKLIIIFLTFILIISFIVGGIIGLILKGKERVEANKKYILSNLSLTDLKGKKVKFNYIKTPTILFFWLPQSKSCQQQLEILEEVNLKRKNQVDIIAVAIGNLKKDTINDIISRKKITYRVVIDKKAELTKNLKITTIPTMIFYSSHKKPILTLGLKTEKTINLLLKKTIN